MADPTFNAKTGLRFKAPVIGRRKPRAKPVRKAPKYKGLIASDGDDPFDKTYKERNLDLDNKKQSEKDAKESAKKY